MLPSAPQAWRLSFGIQRLIWSFQQCFSLALASREQPWLGQTTCPTLNLTQSPCNHLGLIPRSLTFLKGEWLSFPDVNITPSPSPGLSGAEPESRIAGSKNSVPPGYREGLSRRLGQATCSRSPLILYCMESLSCTSYIPCGSGF